MTRAEVLNLGALATVLTRDEYAEKIVAGWNKTRDGILEAGHWLIEAKANLEHGEYLPMIEEQLPFSERTAQRLTAIADSPLMTNTTHGPYLPPSWRTLYEISRLDESTFIEAIEAGVICPEMERNDLASWRKAINRPKKLKQIAARVPRGVVRRQELPVRPVVGRDAEVGALRGVRVVAQMAEDAVVLPEQRDAAGQIGHDEIVAS